MSTAELQPFAHQLHGWGAVVTAIRRGTKRPGHKWERWQTEPQTAAELDALPWRNASAVGIVNGGGDFRVFDIDAVKGDDGRPVAPVDEGVVIDLLRALALPDDYQWSYRSGSGAGWGVVIRCAEALPDVLPAGAGVIIGAPTGGRIFGQLELRWATGQTVIDGAHPTGPGYRWRRGERPFVPPAMLTAAQVARGFRAVAQLPGAPVTPSVTTPATPTPSANGTNGGGHTRYGAAALASAYQLVSTATTGTRNNTLFNQSAAMAELVNGGALARDEVERAMTGAALAAGLPVDEATATIASAFTRVGTTARTPALSANGNGARKAGAVTAESSHLEGAADAERPATQAAGAFRLDDIGNAERFVAQHGDDVRYDHSTGHWYIWMGTHWRCDDDSAIRRRAKATARRVYDEAAAAAKRGDDDGAATLSKWARASAAESRLSAMLKLAQSELPVAITHDRFNRHELLLNCQNGTFDMATGRLRPHDRGDLLTYALPVVYDPAAVCPTWDRFIGRITDGDAALGEFLARAVGYTLSGSTAEQVLLFLYGRGANGKSTFIETVLALLGDLGHKARAQALMADERGGVPNEIAALAGRRLVVASELADGGRLNEGLVKDITGGDTMSARFLYGEPFTFRPAFKLWLYGNHKPVIAGTDDGIWRRVRLIPFTIQIPAAERDPALPAKLRTELTGVLAWAVRGWQNYQRDGLGAPAAVTQATAEYRAESDTLGQFVAECCHVAEGATARGGELYAAYVAWAEQNGLRRPLSNVRFGRALGERGFVNGHDMRGTLWQGVGILAATP